jgi:hypothetical protein
VLNNPEPSRTIGFAPRVIDRHRLAEEIRRYAYQLYVRRGRRHGHDREDWLMAEEAILTKYAVLRRAN